MWKIFISKAFKIEDSLSQVSGNLVETKEISQNNRTLILAILTYPIINNFIPYNWIANNIFLSSLFGIVGIVGLYYLITNRKKIKKCITKKIGLKNYLNEVYFCKSWNRS